MIHRKIFPSSITEFSTENLIKKHTTKSKAIYWLLIFVVVAFVVSLFWTEVDVNVHSRGLITSKEKANRITVPIFGKVLYFNLHENSKIEQGDTLLVIDTLKIRKNTSIVKDKILLLSQQNRDLLYLTSLKKSSKLNIEKLNTLLYKQELRKFQSDLSFQKSQISIARKEYLRQKQLYDKEVIPIAELEQASFKSESNKLQYNKIFDNQLAAWHNQLNNNNTQLYNLSEKTNNLNEEIEKHFVISPITGYVQNLTGLKQGSVVYPNQDICTISPTANLIVETHVSTTDVGLIKNDQEVKFRVDAFNYNQWGMLRGRVVEIAKDINVSEKGVPTFKIRCSLENSQLSYRNKTVSMKKGMTVNANFLLTQRTLAQLLYDKITDWLDPNEIE